MFFSLYYLSNRVMLWAAHRGVPNKGLEMWRGSQAWVWTVPNNIQACWKVLTSEVWIFKLLGVGEVGFKEFLAFPSLLLFLRWGR